MDSQNFYNVLLAFLSHPEELEDVNDDVESTKRSQSTLIEDEGEDPEGILEAEVTDLLKRLLGAC